MYVKCSENKYHSQEEKNWEFLILQLLQQRFNWIEFGAKTGFTPDKISRMVKTRIMLNLYNKFPDRSMEVQLPAL